MNRSRSLLAAVLLAGLVAADPSGAQPQRGAPPPTDGDLVALDFNNVELADVIQTIARLTNKNFIFDDKVRGRVTIISPTRIPIDQAYAVFESVLQVKGFTTVESPGGAIKIIPLREARETGIETLQSSRPPPNRDRFVTRLIPLRYIEAESIVETLKPLVSKDAAMAAYTPTNTVILTESASNIRRILAILESIDVELYKEELAVLKVEHADALTLAEQISDIYGAQVETPGEAAATARRRRTTRQRGPTTAVSISKPTTSVRILTDERTNSLIVLAARGALDDIRGLVQILDVPVLGGGRIHVYYLKHADAEELGRTLSEMISGAPQTPAARPGAAGAQARAQAIRAVVSGLEEGISVTADPATNALVIQASKEGYATLAGVIEQLDLERPQVLVEALIMEVDVTDATDLGFNGVLRLVRGDTNITVQQVTDAAAASAVGMATGGMLVPATGSPLLGNFFRDTTNEGKDNGTLIQGIIRASASDAGTNIISAPHILTSDNEEAEIRIGDNIPIISSRVQSAVGATPSGLSTSVNVERQDIGVTLRVTPQITEGESLRLKIFQEITQINEGISVGDPEDVGVPLSNRRIENTVVVSDDETVVIGGLVSNNYNDTVSKIPWLGDIPILGWAFKTNSRSLTKTNLLVFLTPHIVRSPDELEEQTIRKREEFADNTGPQLRLSAEEREEAARRQAEAEAEGRIYEPVSDANPVRAALLAHQARYPLERMREIEQLQRERSERARAAEADEAARRAPRYLVQAVLRGDEQAARDALTRLLDAGFDGTLVASEVGGVVLYEVQLGPYPRLDEAQHVGEVVQRAHGLAPSVLVVAPEAPEDE